MRLLLDTNALLWLLDDDHRLGPSARAEIERAETLAVSVASLFQIAIMVSIRKLEPIDGLHAAIRDLGFDRVAIADTHLDRLAELPHRHRDPFDRLLICQALVEGLTVVTADSSFAGYSVPVLDTRH